MICFLFNMSFKFTSSIITWWWTPFSLLCISNVTSLSVINTRDSSSSFPLLTFLNAPAQETYSFFAKFPHIPFKINDLLMVYWMSPFHDFYIFEVCRWTESILLYIKGEFYKRFHQLLIITRYIIFFIALTILRKLYQQRIPNCKIWKVLLYLYTAMNRRYLSKQIKNLLNLF